MRKRKVLHKDPFSTFKRELSKKFAQKKVENITLLNA